MEYKSKRWDDRKIAAWFVALALVAVASVLLDRSDISIISICGAIGGVILAIAYLAYCCTANVKRNKFAKYGERFEGKIIAAEVLRNGRGEDTYFLYIEFYDSGKKTRFTGGYIGDPCTKLRNLKCDIYKLDGKYIETNFSARGKKELQGNLSIPTKRYKLFSVHKGCV